MTMISSYYAQVGVGIDRASINNVDSFLNRIERQMQAFQRRISRTSTVNMRVNLDQARFSRDIQRSLNAVGRSITLRIGRIDLAAGISKSLRDRLNASLGGQGRNSIRVSATLSQSSLTAMRQQIRNSLSNMTINPRINPRVTQPRQPANQQPNARGGYGRGQNTQNPHGNRNFSPWHNPMMVGGGVGAFLRYGMYSLPFVAGTMGLNALANSGAELQSQNLALRMTAGNTVGADGVMRDGAYYQNYLSGVGERLGKKTSSMQPFFTQMLAGSRGTKLEPHLEEGFESLMQYTAVMGLGDESTKGAIKAFTQMIGKQQIMAEELRGQAAEHLPPVVRMMADAVTGGDVKKLNEMMQKGQLDPNIHLPMLWKRMRQDSDPMMGEYRNSLRFQRDNSSRQSEEWLKRFLSGGAESGMTSVFEAFSESIKASIPYAESLGDIFERISHFISAMILVPKEMSEWWRGMDSGNNFMTMIFGKSNESEFVQVFKNVFKQISDIVSEAMETSGVSIEKLGAGISKMLTFIGQTLQFIITAIELMNAYNNTGMEGVAWVTKKHTAKRGFEQQYDDNMKAQGLPSVPGDRARFAQAATDSWVTQNPSPVRSSTNAPFSAGGVGQGLADMLAGKSTTSPTSQEGGFWNSLISPFINPWPSPESLSQKATNPMRLGVENIHEAPTNTPSSSITSSSTNTINLTVSGRVAVEGSVETPVNEIQVSSMVSSAVEESISNHLGSTLTQFGSDPN